MIRTARKIHRVTGYLVFIQVILWIAGGVVFSIVPFDSLVKGGAVTQVSAAPSFPGNWLEQTANGLASMGSIHHIQSHNSSQGVLLEVSSEASTQWLRLADGRPMEDPTPESVTEFAATIYTGPGTHLSTRRLDQPDSTVLGLVDELYGREDIWQVNYDDSAGTRLYFDGPSGRYLTVRNDYWVVFDAFWRLHIMDYSEGENFNNWLLRLFSVIAAVFALSGAVLIFNALKRAVSR